MAHIKSDYAEQERLARDVKDTYERYKELNSKRNQVMLQIYKTFAEYKEKRLAEWQTTFKVNKAHEVVERVLPRLIAKNPRWIVEPKVEDFYEDVELPDEPQQKQEELKRRSQLRNEYAKAVQDYLSYLFEEYHLEKPLRAYAKNLIVYGKARAKIGYKYEIVRQFKDPKYKAEVEMDDQGVEIKGEAEPTVEESVAGEYPTIEVKSWTEVLTDPRYREVRDMPAYIEIINAARWSDIKRNKDYFNLDKVKEVQSIRARNYEDDTNDPNAILTIAGVNWVEDAPPDKGSMTLLKYYGFWNHKVDDYKGEKMYEVTIVKECGVVIGFKEITRIPFVECDCFEDTETNYATGFVEPIMGLQKELNFKKNSASEYINQSLNRTWIWSDQSGIDPRDLVSKPGNIIVTTKSGPEAQANCVELPMRQLPSDFFQEQLDIERQIQGQTFTVDTSNPKGEQALTNTATGMRIEFFESNSVIDQVRKQFEQALSELAYQLLQETFEKMDENIVLKKMDADEYWEINREALRDAVKRYTIKVEVNSSSFDDIDNRRKDAIAFFNMLLQAQQAGVPVKLDKAVTDILQTFEKRNPADYFEPPNMAELAQQMPGAEGMPPEGGAPPGGGGQPVNPEDMGQQPQPLPPASELTGQVAQGNLQSAIPPGL